MSGPEHVVVVGAGLGGLSAALHLAGAGRQVTVLEREPIPGGRAGLMTQDGYSFDTGPTVLTMPELIEEAFAAVGEPMRDWLTLTRLSPAYRAWFPDGSALDVIADPDAMAAEVERVCGPAEAAGYLRFAGYTRRLWRLQRKDFIERNFDGPRDLLTANLVRLAAMGAFGRLQPLVDRFFKDPRTRRMFSFQAMYAGVAPQRALALYAVIAYLDAISGVYFPVGGMHAVPAAMAAAAAKHGVKFRYDTPVARIESCLGRARAVVTAQGERIEADAVVLNPDLPAAHWLIEGAKPSRRLRFSPSCVVLHVGSIMRYQKIAHHNIHFGRTWRRTFAEVIDRGRLMSDPSLLVTNPTRTDPGLAPDGRHTYYVLAPVPNLVAGRGLGWRDGLAERYTEELLGTLESRGYRGFAAGAQVCRTVTPADWAALGLAAGTPFSAAHTLRQTGPFRPRNVHPRLSNVVYTRLGRSAHATSTRDCPMWCTPAPGRRPVSACPWC